MNDTIKALITRYVVIRAFYVFNVIHKKHDEHVK